MKEFQLLRYLKKYRFLIALIMLAGCLFVYRYAQSHQTYTAAVTLEYVNETASEGLTPAGTRIDTSEIYSASVVTAAIQDLGISSSVEYIRSGIQVTPIIPEDEETRKEALLEDGEEYEYFPTRYLVTFTSGSETSLGFAEDVLNSVINHYLEEYSQKYVNYVVFPNNATNVSTAAYDYIECAQLLQNSCEDIIAYLYNRAELYPEFRSVQTGYSFGDLVDSYEYIRDTRLPVLFALILNNRIVQDQDVLVTHYTNKLTAAQIQLENCNTTLEKTITLIQQFGDKTLEDSPYYLEDGENSLILGDVELEHDQITNTITTYDKLIRTYVEQQSEKAQLERSIAQNEETLEVFSSAETVTGPGTPLANQMNTDITALSQEMDDLYEVALQTVDEFNTVNSPDNIAVRTSVLSSTSVSVALYMGLALIASLILASLLAVFLGRTGDFVEYFLYIDPKTDLPNRTQCDLQFNKYSAGVLAESFTCVFLQFRFDAVRHSGHDRETGDAALKKLGRILGQIFSPEGFVGYNNSGQFIALLPHCTPEKADALLERVHSEVDYVNNTEDAGIVVDCGAATSTQDKIYEIRDLLHLSIDRARKKEAAHG